MNFPASKQYLQDFLWKLHVLFIHAEVAHWNVTWPRFQSIHEFFEEQYTAVFGLLDDTAERLRALDAEVSASVLMRSIWAVEKSSFDGVSDADELLKAYSSELAILIEGLYPAIEASESEGDVATADFLTGILAALQKTQWMCKALLS